MKSIHWYYYLAVAIVCIGAWYFLGQFGPYISKLVGGKPLPLLTQYVLHFRLFLLGPLIVFFGVALWLTRGTAAESEVAQYISLCLTVIVLTLGLLVLATIRPYSMETKMIGGPNPPLWQGW